MSKIAPAKRLYHPSGDARTHILKVAGQLFYQRGFRAVGVEEIIKAAGIARATLYRHFSGKDDLIVSYLADRESRLTAEMAGLLAQSEENAGPADRIIAHFEALREKETAPDFRGCAFFLAVSEYNDTPAVRDITFRYKQSVRDHFAALLGEDFATGLADDLALLYEGALATMVVRPQSQASHTALRCARSLLITNGYPV